MVETSPLIVHKLKKNFLSPRGSLEAVRGVSFDVRAGECFGLLGPNGAGKSTTINCLTGFYPPTDGECLILGHNVHREPKTARRWLGVCQQEDTLDSDFDVFDQLVRYARFFRIPAADCRAKADELLRRFQLGDKRDEAVENLSGGMRRRLQVARALVSSPRVLVLDEPTTGLDPEVRRSLWDILIDCRARGLAVLLSTHYMEEAERLCDRVAILHQGTILDIAPPEDLVQRHVGKKEVEEEIRPGVRWKRNSNLEDVYLKLTGSRLRVEAAPL